MSANDRWLLPEGIEEILPQEARRLEAMRRGLLDLFDAWGYDLVMPPLIEYLDSLLTGLGEDLDLQTFKLTDQSSGRLMGVRADMTPQVARIEAHYLKRQTPVRLCYIGPVLRTRPDGFGGSREPLQLGAELFGYPGPEGDAEILQLLVAAMNVIGLPTPHVDLGHVGVFRELARAAGLDARREHELFDALQRKARPEIEALLAASGVTGRYRTMFSALTELNGDVAVLDEARVSFKAAGAGVQQALDNLRAVATWVAQLLPRVPLYFDLAELRGYRYHTGVVFSAFVPGHGQAVAAGGRYDNIGSAFGYARPATGFSADLRALLRLAPAPAAGGNAIGAPFNTDPVLSQEIARLRASGERVAHLLSGDAGRARELGCNRELVQREGRWRVVNL